MFWLSFFNFVYLIEFLYNIVKEWNLDLLYYLYVFLYGICCLKDESLLKLINGMFCDKFEKIRECVLKFKDCDENCIYYYIIGLDCLDWFVVFVIN